MLGVRGRRALIASLAFNVVTVAAVVFLLAVDERDLASRFRGGASLKGVVERPPKIPYRAEHRLSMIRFDTGLRGEALTRWRGRVLGKLRDLLDLPPVPAKYRPEWVPQPTSATAYALARTTIPSPAGFDRIVIYRLVPRRQLVHQRKPAAVMAIPGTGEDALDGLLGRIDDYQRSAAERLAEHGYAVYAAESFGIGERGFDPGWLADLGYHSQQVAGMYGLYSGHYLATIYLADLEAELRVIQGDPSVNGEKIATFGISRGANLSMLAAALNSEVDGAVIASGLRDMDNYVHYFFDHALIPAEGRYFLRSDVAGTIAPRPLLITYGRRVRAQGPVFGEGQLQVEVRTLRTARRTRSIYRMFGAASKVTVALHASGHTWDEAATFTFLRRLFGY
jgi:dienelactone hydrolase